MLRGMLWRAAVIVAAGGFLLYRATLWLEIRRARRAGDRDREQWLRGRTQRLVRWLVLALFVVIVLLTVLVARNSG